MGISSLRLNDSTVNYPRSQNKSSQDTSHDTFVGSLNRKGKPLSLSLLVVVVVGCKVNDELLTVCFGSFSGCSDDA